MLLRSGLFVAPDNRGFAAAFVAIVSLIVLRVWVNQPLDTIQTRLRDFSEDVLAFLTISLLGVLASYSDAAATSGFSDATLAHYDSLLHFDWLLWYREVAAHSVLQYLGEAAYSTIYVSPIVLIGYFAVTQQRARSRQFLATFWLGVVITLALFPLFPAEGPLAYLWRGPIPYMPISALYQEQLIPALRMHRVTDIDLGALRGLVCAPSFHTVSAVIFIATAWPVRRLRWPILAINAAMLLATPVEGTHYLSDMIVGLLVALIAITVVRLGQRARLAKASSKGGRLPAR
jgi:membrane-associated phospholipid phosphatase